MAANAPRPKWVVWRKPAGASSLIAWEKCPGESCGTRTEAIRRAGEMDLQATEGGWSYTILPEGQSPEKR